MAENEEYVVLDYNSKQEEAEEKVKDTPKKSGGIIDYGLQTASNIIPSAINLVKNVAYEPIKAAAQAEYKMLQSIPAAIDMGKSVVNLDTQISKMKESYEKSGDPALLAMIETQNTAKKALIKEQYNNYKKFLSPIDTAKSIFNTGKDIAEGLVNRYIASDAQAERAYQGGGFNPLDPLLDTVKTDPVGVAADVYSLKGPKKLSKEPITDFKPYNTTGPTTPGVVTRMGVEAEKAKLALSYANELKQKGMITGVSPESVASNLDVNTIRGLKSIGVKLEDAPTRLITKEANAGGKGITNTAKDIERVSEIRNKLKFKIQDAARTDKYTKDIVRKSSIKGEVDMDQLIRNLLEDVKNKKSIPQSMIEMLDVYNAQKKLAKPGISIKDKTGIPPSAIAGAVGFMANGLGGGIAGLGLLGAYKGLVNFKNFLNNNNSTRIVIAQMKYQAKNKLSKIPYGAVSGSKAVVNALDNVGNEYAKMGGKGIIYQQALKELSEMNDSTSLTDKDVSSFLRNVGIVQSFEQEQQNNEYQNIIDKSDNILSDDYIVLPYDYKGEEQEQPVDNTNVTRMPPNPLTPEPANAKER